MTKLSILGGIAALLLGVVPAFAYSGIHFDTSSSAMSNTGNNTQEIFSMLKKSMNNSSNVTGGSQSITTGAASATSNSSTTVNLTANTLGGVLDGLSLGVGGYYLPKVHIDTSSTALSDTGNNYQGMTSTVYKSMFSSANIGGGSQTTNTGNATSTSNASTLVNVSISSLLD
ncbi:hypothetical protein M1116_02705 [Patescibacteria group bacterium]|nr:hypothetical protein [Patescibacteria group bacterium]